MKLVAGNSNRALAEAIAAYLATPLTKAVVRRFADMEIFVEIQENVRGQDAFVVQSTSFPANDHLMELLIIIDALRRASAKRITAVVPYFGYARQDRKPGPRTPISAKLVANLITHAGADRYPDPRADRYADARAVRRADLQVCRAIFRCPGELQRGRRVCEDFHEPVQYHGLRECKPLRHHGRR